MADIDDHKDSARTLVRLARALGVPPEAFFDPVAQDPTPLSDAEEAELLHLFREIDDVQQRRRYLELLRTTAKKLSSR